MPEVLRSRHHYGEHPDQFLELHGTPGDARGLAIVVHGGFWRARYGLEYGRRLARAIARRGWLAANLEYRRVGARSGGGWPATAQDLSVATDALAELVPALTDDGSPVIALGHSAGGQLAAWLAGPRRLDDRPAPVARVRVTGAVLQAGVLDLASAARTRLGDSAVPAFMGGAPDEVPERYRAADPIVNLPLGLPTLCVHTTADADVPIAQSRAYVEAAQAAGDPAELVVLDGDHFVHVTGATAAEAAALDWVEAQSAGGG